jgi:hypothetical protein
VTSGQVDPVHGGPVLLPEELLLELEETLEEAPDEELEAPLVPELVDPAELLLVASVPEPPDEELEDEDDVEDEVTEAPLPLELLTVDELAAEAVDDREDVLDPAALEPPEDERLADVALPEEVLGVELVLDAATELEVEPTLTVPELPADEALLVAEVEAPVEAVIDDDDAPPSRSTHTPTAVSHTSGAVQLVGVQLGTSQPDDATARSPKPRTTIRLHILAPVNLP